MVLHDGLLEWNGCSVGMLMTSESTDSLVERICVCIDACADSYVLGGIAVSVI